MEGQKRFLRKNKEMLDAELWAVLEALDIARKETLNAKNAYIKIFCDSQKAIKAIEHPFIYQGNRFLRNSIYQKAKELQHNGHPIAIRWTPSHSASRRGYLTLYLEMHQRNRPHGTTSSK